MCFVCELKVRRRIHIWREDVEADNDANMEDVEEKDEEEELATKRVVGKNEASKVRKCLNRESFDKDSLENEPKKKSSAPSLERTC
jgi:hypothetical protein